MAQFFYFYGTMNSGKSIEILKVAHNYEEQGKDVILLTSGLDDRSGKGKVASRIGIESEAYALEKNDNVMHIIEHLMIQMYPDYPNNTVQPSCILVDEAQFLTKQQVIELARIVDEWFIPVMAFGLKNDFQNNLFEGSEALLLYADKIEEIKTICAAPDCGKKAIMNARFKDGKQVMSGEQIQIGDEEYKPLCRKHFIH